MPPTSLILETLRDIVLPAAGGSALTFALFFTRRRTAPFASSAAVIVGFVWANFTFGTLEWEGTHRLIPWKPDRSTWHFLPRAAVVLLGVGLVTRWLGLLVGRFLPERRWWVQNLLVWLPRWIAILIVGSWLIPVPWVEVYTWLKPALCTAMLFSWVALDGTARSESNGQTAFALSAMFLAAAGVIIHAHSKLFMDVAVVLGFAMFGVALVARAARVEASGAIPAGVAFLPALLLNVRYQTESLVPLACFWLVGLAPLVLLPFLIPRVARQNRWLVGTARLVFVLIPLVIAVVLAMENEQLPPEEDW